jgi:hypothetical protein
MQRLGVGFAAVLVALLLFEGIHSTTHGTGMSPMLQPNCSLSTEPDRRIVSADATSTETASVKIHSRSKRLQMLQAANILEKVAGGASSAPAAGALSTAAPDADGPYDMIVGLSHHKSGTFQLRCMLHYFAEAAGLEDATGVCFRDNSVGADTLAGCLENGLNRPEPAKRPLLFKTFHGMKQKCESTEEELAATTVDGTFEEPWFPCLSFMISKVCPQDKVCNMQRPAKQCYIDLQQETSGRLGFFNIVRNPIDLVLSAYSFHISRPKSEPWMHRPHPVMWTSAKLRWAGADDATLETIGLADAQDQPEISYVDMLTRLPVESGILMEFWHSLPEMLSMARQYRLLKGQPGAFQARFEALRDEYNATLLAGLEHLRFGEASQGMLDATVVGGCDPGVWTAEQRAASDHVTTGKKEGEKEAAQAALMGYKPARDILCQLCDELDYTDARCGGRSVTT